MRKLSTTAWLSCVLLVLMIGCAGQMMHQAPVADGFAGDVVEIRTYVSGRSERLHSGLTGTVRPVRGGVAFGVSAFAGKSEFALDGTATFVRNVLAGIHMRDRLGGETTATFGLNGTYATLLERFPDGAQINRAGGSDGSYRAVQKLQTKAATLVVRSSSDARGNANWKVDVFPHSSSSSTYYGFLNDAEMVYDVAFQDTGGEIDVFSDGGYEKGYDDPPAMRAVGAEPAWFAPKKLITLYGNRMQIADPAAGMLETIRTSVASGGAAHVVEVDETIERRLIPMFSAGVTETVSMIEMRASVNTVAPSYQVAQIVREQMRRWIRIELERQPEALVVIRRKK